MPRPCSIKSASTEGSAGPVRFLDQDLDALGRLFAKHSPWVARVDRVERASGGRIVVRLSYRTPTARIDLGSKRFVAIADDGVVLPGEDIRPEDAERLLAIQDYRDTMSLRPGLFLGAETSGKVPRDVAALVALARQIHERQDGATPGVVLLNLAQMPKLWASTKRNHAVFWGRLPDEPEQAEPTVAEKLARLGRWEEANPDETFSEKEYLQFTKDGIERMPRKPRPAREDPGGSRPYGG